jgi:hypothetical protein
MSKICDICCENYNQSTRAKITCEYADCQYSACKACTRTYLVGTTSDPNCMNCKKIWSDQFLVKNLNRTFCEKEYKQHRKELLVDRELSKLPETMIFAEQTKKIRREEEKIAEIKTKVIELNKQLRELKDANAVHYNNIHRIRHGTYNNDKETERRKFIMNCPHEGCRGFLSTQYKCELCENYTCPHCLEVIGISKDIPHTCNPDNVASAEFIKKDSKPCPQCGTRIHKIQGCSQMWCTQCHVAFDYNTLKIDTGRVHNPEYYRYMRENNLNGTAPRNPGDLVCGGIIQLYQLTRTILPIIKQAIITSNPDKIALDNNTEYEIYCKYLNDIHRIISHIAFYDLPRIRTNVNTLENNRNLRISYILSEITKHEFADKVYRSDIKRKRERELLHIYELLNLVGTENFNTLYNDSRELGSKRKITIDEASKFLESLDEKIKVLDNLRDYTNKRFAKISVTYNLTVLNINDVWELEKKKYNVSELAKD